MGPHLPLLACLALAVASPAAEPSPDPRLEAASAAARDAGAGLLQDLRGGADPGARAEALEAARKDLDLVAGGHEALKARLSELTRSADGIRGLSAALKNPEELRRTIPNPYDTTPDGAARTSAFVDRVAAIASPLGVKERPAVETIALFYLRKRSPAPGGSAAAGGQGGTEGGATASRSAALPGELGGGPGFSANFGRSADGSREREDSVAAVAANSARRPDPSPRPAAQALRADVAPVRGPDAPPSPPKTSGPPDPPLRSTSHQAMADAIVGEFGIVSIQGKPDAMQVVITARGGGENGTAGIKGEGGPEWARARLSAMFPGEAPFTDPADMRLARIDHIINVQKAVNDVAPIKESDPWYVKAGKSLKRMPTAAGGAVVTVLYDSSKLVDQTFGTRTGSLGGQDFSQASPADLKNTLGALWMAVKSPFLVEE